MVRLVLIACLALAGCGESYRDETAAMVPVAEVDLDRYAGRWYEIARFPVWFQRGCTGVTADYEGLPDGLIGVVNTCREDGLDGPVKEARGTARSVDPTNSRLKVKFSDWLPFEGDYWVIYLDPDYQTAVVGVPSGSAGWILSRTPQIAPERLEEARDALAANGYDLARLTMTQQPAN
jgi:apolipoprotein D and lipocalin family protein